MQTQTLAIVPDFQALAREIIDHLPGIWVAATEDNGPGNRYIRIADSEGRTIDMYHNAYPKPHLSITGAWQLMRSPRNYWYVDSAKPYDQPRPSINVSPQKSGKAIAGDIIRRFLPDFIPLWDKTVEIKARSEAAAQSERHTAKTLAAMAGITLQTPKPNEEPRNEFSKHPAPCGGWFTVKPYSDGTATIECHSMPFATAEKIIRAMMEPCPDTGPDTDTE